MVYLGVVNNLFCNIVLIFIKSYLNTVKNNLLIAQIIIFIRWIPIDLRRQFLSTGLPIRVPVSRTCKGLGQMHKALSSKKCRSWIYKMLQIRTGDLNKGASYLAV